MPARSPSGFGRRPLGFLLVLAVALAGATAMAQDFRTGTLAGRYALLCANCHGRNLDGSGTGPSLLKDTWLHGGDDESIARSIRTGFPEKGMPAWGDRDPGEGSPRHGHLSSRSPRQGDPRSG